VAFSLLLTEMWGVLMALFHCIGGCRSPVFAACSTLWLDAWCDYPASRV